MACYSKKIQKKNSTKNNIFSNNPYLFQIYCKRNQYKKGFVLEKEGE